MARFVLSSVLLAVGAAGLLSGGQFRYVFASAHADDVTLHIPRPAQVRVSGKLLAAVLEDKTGQFVGANELRAAVENVL